MNNEKFPPRSRFLTLLSRSGLRAHMTISYMSVTIGSVLSFMLLAVLASGAVSAFFSDSLPSTFVALALANAARHSSATLISLYLAPNGKMVQLVITDNGEGFHANECSERHGLGIQIMQERVQELQGTFQIETAPGQGTRIAVSLPTEEVYDTCCAG